MWIISALLSAVSLPSLNPDPLAEPGPMEHLGSAGTALALSTLVLGLREPLPWLAAISPRPHWQRRAARALACVATALVGIALSHPLVPAVVAPGDRGALIVVLAALALWALVLGGSTVATLVPVATVIISSLPGIVPWRYCLFNDVALEAACLPAGVLTALGLAAWILRGPAEAGA